MTEPDLLRDRKTIADFYLEDPLLHIYELGDLDDFFFQRTAWHALRLDGEVQAIALRYNTGGLPVLIALDRRDPSPYADLLSTLRKRRLLPARYYAHLSPGLVASAAGVHQTIRPHGRHLKMALLRPKALERYPSDEGIEVLGPENGPALTEFYGRVYPGNWFDPAMLETGRYLGIRYSGELACVAGVHVVSSKYRVAAIGNVATAPEHRGRGLASAACASLTRKLLKDADHIGLNVHATNHRAISAYMGIGFDAIGEYFEFDLS